MAQILERERVVSAEHEKDRKTITDRLEALEQRETVCKELETRAVRMDAEATAKVAMLEHKESTMANAAEERERALKARVEEAEATLKDKTTHLDQQRQVLDDMRSEILHQQRSLQQAQQTIDTDRANAKQEARRVIDRAKNDAKKLIEDSTAAAQQSMRDMRQKKEATQRQLQAAMK